MVVPGFGRNVDDWSAIKIISANPVRTNLTELLNRKAPTIIVGACITDGRFYSGDGLDLAEDVTGEFFE